MWTASRLVFVFFNRSRSEGSDRRRVGLLRRSDIRTYGSRVDGFNGMVGAFVVFVANLFRFLRLFAYGDRPGAYVQDLRSRKLQLPYISRSVTEFWRRWHITLSSWFRDYVYIPLGGDRCGRLRTYINLWTVFLLCGLWHGASWNFIVWGAYHGALLAWERKMGRAFLQALWPPLAHAYAVIAVALGWVLFRCVSLDHAGYFFKTLIGLGIGVDK